MPPRYLRRSSPTRLKPCQERTFEACETVPTDQCCGVIPCKLCIEWEVEYEEIQHGSAEFSTASWTGTVGGHSFTAFWERNYDGECEYVVTLGGEEVYRATCYEGASCRDPGGEVQVATAYLEGTLRWSKHEPRELHLIDDPDTGCRDHFCGVCRCSCNSVCVTITEPGGDVFTGELFDTAYACDPPVWAGSVGYYDLSFALGRDEYTGECIVTLTADGEEQDPVFVTGCADMSAIVTLYDGTIISIECKQCACNQQGPCEFCCLPVRYDVSHPFGVLADIPFSISGCNGESGVFVTMPGDEPCQTEAIYDTTTVPSLSSILYSETGGTCSSTPCGTGIILKLECSALFAEPGDDQVCDRLRLWIGTTLLQTGDTGETPGGATTAVSWTWVRPISCTCDPTTGVSAIFPLEVEVDCYEEPIGAVGDCAGKRLNCCTVICSGTLNI
jgi:hypothetical protein